LGVQDPFDTAAHRALLDVRRGGIATSGTAIRRWSTAAGETAHHLIDPRTAEPASTSLLTATVLAADAATAEVFATAAMVVGDGPAAVRLLDEVGLAGIMFASDGREHRSARLEDFVP
jgi:thiamine biosynthesis lipoprotein